MKRHENTIFDFTEDEDDKLLTTTHGGQIIKTSSIAIHCTNNGYDGFRVYITMGQARNLMGKLQESIINLEVHEKTQRKED